MPVTLHVMMLALGCGGPLERPSRWAQVEAQADLGACAPVSATLADLSSSSGSVVVRQRLVAWHLEDPDARVVLPDAVAFAILGAWTDDERIEDDEAPALAHYAHTLDRCGALTQQLMALAIAKLACDQPSPAFVLALAGYGGLGDLRGVAAREALSVSDLVRPLGEEGWFGRRQAQDVGETYEQWALSEDLTLPAPANAYTRPTVRMLTTGLAGVWPQVLQDRAALASCLAPAPGR